MVVPTLSLRYGTECYRFIFAAKQPTPETDQAFREAVGTFRRLAQAEIDLAKPLRVRVLTVKPGDTTERARRQDGPFRPRR